MKTKKIITGLLSAAMVTGIAAPVFADGPVTGGTEASPLKASITKVLETGEKTTTPAATWTFNFVQQDGVTTDSAGTTIETVQTSDAAVAIGPVTASTTATMTGTEADGKKTVEVQSADFLENVTFPHAGIYVYSVTEEQSGYTIADPTKETVVYSGAEYTLYLYVANGNNGTYVKSLGCVLTKDDNGKGEGDAGVSGNVGSKVDPTPNPNPGTDGSVNADNSEMKFTNKYIKQPGNDNTPDPTDPDNQMLSVGKTVTGDLGDKTKFFDFSITLNKLAIQDTEQSYTGYIMNADNQAVTGADLPTGYTNNQVSFTTGTATTVKLKDGQKIVFPEVPVGTHFSATETTVAEYTPSAVVTEDGTAITTKNAAVTTGDAAASGVKGGNDVIVGENKSGVQVTNAYRDTTPTGILLNNKPAFFAIIIAIGAGIAAVVVGAKLKKRVR